LVEAHLLRCAAGPDRRGATTEMRSRATPHQRIQRATVRSLRAEEPVKARSELFEVSSLLPLLAL
jgi:hypothetical protein